MPPWLHFTEQMLIYGWGLVIEANKVEVRVIENESERPSLSQICKLDQGIR
jgi:hypothetical protein